MKFPLFAHFREFNITEFIYQGINSHMLKFDGKLCSPCFPLPCAQLPEKAAPQIASMWEKCGTMWEIIGQGRTWWEDFPHVVISKANRAPTLSVV